MCEKFYQIRSFEEPWIFTSDTSISQKWNFHKFHFTRCIVLKNHESVECLKIDFTLYDCWRSRWNGVHWIKIHCPRVFPFVPFESWHVAKFHVICKVENTFTFCEMTSNSVSVSELTPQVSLYLQSGKHFHFLWNGVQQCNVSFRSVL